MWTLGKSKGSENLKNNEGTVLRAEETPPITPKHTKCGPVLVQLTFGRVTKLWQSMTASDLGVLASHRLAISQVY